MKKTVAALSLLTLAACATPQQEGPPTAFRLTSPGSFDNAMLPPKSAGDSPRTRTAPARTSRRRWRGATRRTRPAASPSSGTTRPAAPGSAFRTR